MTTEHKVCVIGGGPSGLMAAEVLSQAGCVVDLYDAMPSVGRKFLLAGKGGLNLTHSEESARFVQRYGERGSEVARWLSSFDGPRLRAWAEELGVATFVGTSGRVFPVDMKAAPLLRAWLHRLRGAGVRLHMRHRWAGWVDDAARVSRFETGHGPVELQADATVLALGGASWARLGSDGAWVPVLQQRGVTIATLLPANCGFDVARVRHGAGGDGNSAQPAAGWSDYFAERFAGQPFKSVAICCPDGKGGEFRRKGEFVATATGIEGSLVYAASALLRDAIALDGQARLTIDLLPDKSAEQVLAEVAHPRGSRSLSSHLKSRLKLDGIKLALLHEVLDAGAMHKPDTLAAAIKAVPMTLIATRPIDEAISTAGGVRLDAMDDGLMLRALPGVFCAGEMLDWEAPTGGYLLTAAMASGRIAAQGAIRWLADNEKMKGDEP